MGQRDEEARMNSGRDNLLNDLNVTEHDRHIFNICIF